jgi:hypothetical protein
MQMSPIAIACTAHFGNNLALAHRLTFSYQKALIVTINSDKTITMSDLYA